MRRIAAAGSAESHIYICGTCTLAQASEAIPTSMVYGSRNCYQKLLYVRMTKLQAVTKTSSRLIIQYGYSYIGTRCLECAKSIDRPARTARKKGDDLPGEVVAFAGSVCILSLARVRWIVGASARGSRPPCPSSCSVPHLGRLP